MTRFLQHAVLAAGLAAIGWVGIGYAGTNPLALAITVLVGAFYLVGALELHRFEQATSALRRALAALSDAPASLAAWLAPLPPSLLNPVRLRIEGERVGLPGPSLTPYLAGLLVLLGMLGTFVGMVVTLNGTGIALESATDLQSIRASLSAPVKGLGLAFGTSVAGVAASAMLGLASALCRRERLQAGQLLDARIATSLRVFSLAHQREESFKLLQQQAHAMPELADRLQAMMAAMERQSLALNERLMSAQDRFHGNAEVAYAGIAASVDRSLRESLTESARAAGATIQPVVEATMAGIAREAASLHQGIGQSVQRHLDGMTDRLEVTTASVADRWTSALADQQRANAAQDRQRLTAWTEALAQSARDIAAQTQAHARSTAAEIAQLLQAAAQAPKAAAEVIAELRQTLTDGMVRDNAMLEERARILETLETLLGAVNHASTEQRSAIDALVAASASLLDRVGTRFTDQVDAGTERMAEVAAQVTGSAVEVASLGEAFGFGVELFSQSNDKLMTHLQRIEGALGKSLARSDEQLDYYVAQAREVIDLSIMSQKQIVEDLQQLADRRATVGSEA